MTRAAASPSPAPSPLAPRARPRRPLGAAVRRMLRVVDVVASGDASIRDLWRPGFSVTAARMLARIASHVPALDLILDAGANTGQFTLAALRRYPAARVVAVEPVPHAAALLRERTRDTDRVAVHQCALGRESGEITLFQHEYSHVSSILPIHAANRHPNYDAEKVRPLTVEVARLDELVPIDALAGPALLKLDVQGYEREVLAGAQRILSQIDYVVVEVAFAELYEDQPLFDEVHRLLRDGGYELVAPVGFQHGAEGVVIEMDGLYHRRDA